MKSSIKPVPNKDILEQTLEREFPDDPEMVSRIYAVVMPVFREVSAKIELGRRAPTASSQEPDHG